VLGKSSLDAVFRGIHTERLWSGSVSGPGALPEQTAVIRVEVPKLLERLAVRTILDIPCGDRRWISSVHLPVDRYIGADIDATLVAQHQPDPRHEFRRLDITRDALPTVDLILCRDLLGHLSFPDVTRALERVKGSGSTYLLTTTFAHDRVNLAIRSGDWRPINLCGPPFNLSPPMLVINEQCTERNGIYADKALGLWKIAEL
jgi:hypothetical protein